MSIEPFANPALAFPEKYCPVEPWNLMDKEKKKSLIPSFEVLSLF